MYWGDVEQKTNSSGCRYLEFNERETKTRNGCNGETRPFPPKMFEKKDDPNCPVKAFEEYKKRRPERMNVPDARFYLQINRNRKDNDPVWYKCQPLGKNYIGGMVKTMAEKAQITDKSLPTTVAERQP